MSDMLSKSEIQTAEELSARHTLEELSNTSRVLSSLSQLQENHHPDVELIRKAVQFVTNEMFYIFGGTDELAGELGDGDEEGVNIYRRTWNKLCTLRSELYSIETALEILKKQNITEVITGPISSQFLDIESRFFTEYNDIDLEITRFHLADDEVSFLRSNQIKVRILSILV